VAPRQERNHHSTRIHQDAADERRIAPTTPHQDRNHPATAGATITS
jgi:hypothetical protein